VIPWPSGLGVGHEANKPTLKKKILLQNLKEMKLEGYLCNDMKQYTKIYGVDDYIRKLGCRNWLANALDRGRW